MINYMQGRTDVACSRWEGLLASERGKEEGRGSKVYPFVAMQYASFLRQVRLLAPPACLLGAVSSRSARLHDSRVGSQLLC